nr:retrovirus-related Pol polyprotein from transposon TNT 1-94 [Tanacetum cinerariifolium]
MVTLGRLLPHARGLGFKPRRGGFPSGAKKEWGLSPKAKVRVLHTAQLDVTDLVNLPEGSKQVGCKWVFKTKCDSKGNVKRYKARLVAKVAHFDLELHKVDVKAAFLNGNLREEVSMEQPEGFFIDGKENMINGAGLLWEVMEGCGGVVRRWWSGAEMGRSRVETVGEKTG